MAQAVDVSAIEAACYGRAPDRLRTVLVLMDRLLVEWRLESDDPPRTFTRLAAAVAALLADPQLDIDEADLASLLTVQSPLNNLFTASGFRGADHLARLLPERLLPLLSIDSARPLDVDLLIRRAGDLSLLACANAISTTPLLTLDGERHREAVLARAAQGSLGPIPLKMSAIGRVTDAWMLCSYASDPGKHAVKAVFNAAFRDLLDRLGLARAAAPVRDPGKVRPTLVVCAEVMNATHVQYRYYAQYLRQLRTRFRLVLVTGEPEADAGARALFDEVRAFRYAPDGAHLGWIVEAIAREQPDMIFWPSLGMAHWGPLLANLRLAPIQVVGIGHPAPTMIPTIDYVLLEEGFLDAPEAFEERAILLPDAGFRLERPPGYEPVAPRVREAADPVRIALPCNILKLNPSFVALLGRLRREAGREIEYHLFPNARALQAAAFRAACGEALGEPVIHPRLSPSVYLHLLNRCDIALSPFPFGGFHSVIDCLRQAIPVVAMDPPDNPVKTDRMIMRLLGMPDWLVASDEDAYVAAALRLIRDDALRLEMGRKALAAEIDTRLVADGDSPPGHDVVDALWAVHRHHETLQALPPGALRLRDLPTA